MRVIITLLVASVLWGCTGAKKTGKVTDGTGGEFSGQYDESFDPTTLNDDDIEIAKEEVDVKDPVKENNGSSSVSQDKASQNKEIDGWRVQILATKNIENATLIHQEASDQFALSNLKAYLIFEAPLYKVRVGDARDRNEAEIVRELARDYGYLEAFIVRSKINVVQDSLQFQP